MRNFTHRWSQSGHLLFQIRTLFSNFRKRAGEMPLPPGSHSLVTRLLTLKSPENKRGLSNKSLSNMNYSKLRRINSSQLWLDGRCKEIMYAFLLWKLISNTAHSFNICEFTGRTARCFLKKNNNSASHEIKGLSSLIKRMGKRAHENDKLSIRLLNVCGKFKCKPLSITVYYFHRMSQESFYPL